MYYSKHFFPRKFGFIYFYTCCCDVISLSLTNKKLGLKVLSNICTNFEKSQGIFRTKKTLNGMGPFKRQVSINTQILNILSSISGKMHWRYLVRDFSNFSHSLSPSVNSISHLQVYTQNQTKSLFLLQFKYIYFKNILNSAGKNVSVYQRKSKYLRHF